MEYRGFVIDTTTYPGLVTVVYCGDEVAFDSVAEAEIFIDEVTA